MMMMCYQAQKTIKKVPLDENTLFPLLASKAAT
jgi:hypothetical protein